MHGQTVHPSVPVADGGCRDWILGLNLPLEAEWDPVVDQDQGNCIVQGLGFYLLERGRHDV